MNNTKYTHRLIARILIEADTPLAVGSGVKEMLTDSPVMLDVNGLPYIPGTSLAGVIRHAIGEVEAKKFFGHQDNGGHGSEIIFTDAVMIGAEGKAVDGLTAIDWSDTFYRHFKNLPIRQHVRIGDKGIAEKGGKFDNQVVFKGTRFIFEIEMVSDGSNFSEFEKVLQTLKSQEIRLGGGTRKGYGKIKVEDMQVAQLNLKDGPQLEAYLDKSSSLSEAWSLDAFSTDFSSESASDHDVIRYDLTLTPDDFFFFGAGVGDDEVDAVSVTEDFITWDANGEPRFTEGAILIPASSIKGALAHRTAYHYNRLHENWADKETQDYTGVESVRDLFGYTDGNKAQRGLLLFEDIIIENKKAGDKMVKEKVFNHVSIDRFTGGAIDGALYNEKALYCSKALSDKEKSFTTTITLTKEFPDNTKEAFECALRDLITGLLHIGGGVNKGYGSFTGECPQLKGKEEK